MTLDEWAKDLAAMLRRLNPIALVRAEAPALAKALALASPVRTGRLRKSWLAHRMSVLSRSIYATFVDRGGRIVARNRATMVIPFGRYRIGAPGYVTVADRYGKGGSIVDRSTGRLVGVRRHSVRIRARRYLERGRESFVVRSETRMAARLERMAPRG